MIDRSDDDFITLEGQSKQVELFRDVLAFNKLILRNGLKVSSVMSEDDYGLTVESGFQKLHVNDAKRSRVLPNLLKKIQASDLIESIHAESQVVNIGSTDVARSHDAS